MSEYVHQKRAPARPATRRPAAAKTGSSKLTAKADGLAAAPKVQALTEAKAALARPNRTGLPDRLKATMEKMSGIALDHVRVRFNSPKPAAIDADAFAQGGDIHLGPGQAHHLPHEAWHVVQQAQGRVRPTARLESGAPLNDDRGLEREADVMGARAAKAPGAAVNSAAVAAAPNTGVGVLQGMFSVFSGAARPAAVAAGRAGVAALGGHAAHHTAAAAAAAARLAAEQARRAEEQRKAQEAARLAAEMEAMRRSAAAAAAAAAMTRPLIPRASATTYGPDLGYLLSGPTSKHRATVNTAEVLRSIDRTGFTSPAVRAGETPPTTAPEAEEITAYSGVDGKASQFRKARLVGLNEDVPHTVDVAARTSGVAGLAGLAAAPQTGPEPKFGRLDEVETSGLHLHSVEAAFRKTGETAKYPTAGEFVSAGTIPATALRHTSAVPLSRRPSGEALGQPGQVHPSYLPNLGLLTGATPDAPQTLKIKTHRRPHPTRPDEFIEFDHFTSADEAAAGGAGHEASKDEDA